MKKEKLNEFVCQVCEKHFVCNFEVAASDQNHDPRQLLLF